MIEDVVAPGSRVYFLLAALLGVSRGLDFLSTWLATPNLVLEANPIARKLGWRGGIAVNLLVCLLCACWPLPAIIVMTTSVLVAARNFQSAWLMRSLGENAYRVWMVERLAQSNRLVFVFCVLAQVVLVAAVGGTLVGFSGWRLVPFAMGMGIIVYAFALGVFTLIGARRIWRNPVPAAGWPAPDPEA
jgi:hypothetical protein